MILEADSDELSEIDVAFDQSRSNKSVEPKASIRDLSVWRLINKFFGLLVALLVSWIIPNPFPF